MDEEISCIDAPVYARRPLEHSQPLAPRVPLQFSEIEEISKTGWGGARPNSGGARPGAGRPSKQIVVAERTEEAWHVLQTAPAVEQTVAREIARRGTATYCPMEAIRRPDPVVVAHFITAFVPMFRGYIFAEFDVRQPWGWMRDEIRGARGFLRNTLGRPAPLAAGFVEKLREGDADRLKLRDVQLSRSELEKRAHKVGAVALVAVGNMVDLRGMVMSCDGLTTVVEVDLFGRRVPVGLAWDQVVIVGCARVAAE